MTHLRSAGCAALLCAIGGVAQAAPITYYFTGTFSRAEGSLSALAGQAYDGRFEYDIAATAIFTGLNFRQYRMPAGSLAAAASDGSGASSIRGLPDDPLDSLMDVVWDANITSATLGGFGSYIYARGDSDSTGAWAEVAGISLILLDTSGLALGPASPLLSPLAGIASWSGTEFAVGDVRGARAAGALNCISADRAACVTAQVPEPGTLALLGLALGGVGFTRRR